MSPLRARVEKGRLVLDEPTSLPDGTIVNLVADDECDDLTVEERRALRTALSTSWTSAKEGRFAAGVCNSRRAAPAPVSLPVRTTPEADTQIREIDDWWRMNRPASRDLFLQELTAQFDLISDAPQIGRRTGSLKSRTRGGSC
jgi:hypothetical protein